MCVSIVSECRASISLQHLSLVLQKNVDWRAKYILCLYLCVFGGKRVYTCVCRYKRLSVVLGQLWEVNNKESCLSSLLPSLYSLYFLLDWEGCECIRERKEEGEESMCVSVYINP